MFFLVCYYIVSQKINPDMSDLITFGTDTGTDIYWHSCSLKLKNFMKRGGILKQETSNTHNESTTWKDDVEPASCYGLKPVMI